VVSTCEAREGGGRGTIARSGDKARAWQRSTDMAQEWQRSDRDEERCRYAPPHPSPPHKCMAPGDLTH
jgi:hypothetical protein